MEQTTLERRVRVIPATKTTPTSGPRRGGRQRVAAYCRVSTDSEEQLNSYAAQKNYYTQKIEENPDWEMAGVFADEGITGTSMKKRAEFNRMIAACKRGRIDMILTKSASRFARNTVDCLKVIRALKARGIRVIFEKENINTLTESSEFLITLFSSFSQAESESMSLNIIPGIQQSMKEGNIPFQYSRTLGYRRGPDGKPEIDPDEAETVRLIYTRYLEGRKAGYDYTIYDKNTLRDYCGGQIDPLKVDEHFSQGGLRPVVDTILISMPELTGETVEAVPLELLETFHEKAFWKLLESLLEKVPPNTQEAAEPVPPPRNDTKEPPEHFAGEDAAVLDTALDEYPMPDPAYSKEDAERDFAYLEGYLLPLPKERAEALMEKDFSIYAIVDEYARMVFDREELDQCPPDIAYAMPTGEWEESPEFHQAVADRMNHQEEREQAFLRHAGDCFAIYQIKDDDPDRLRFMDMDWLTSKGLTVDRARYELAYTGELACGLGSSALGQLWEKFNIHHPADYHRPSMSVSDIIAVKQDGVIYGGSLHT